MSAYHLGDLTLKNYRSFKNETVRFKRKGMTLLRGFNRDTGGSSYAGKSSVPNAVALALGFCPFSIKDQQTWGSKGGMSISQELITDQGAWEITRGSKTSIQPPGRALVTGAVAVDEELKKLTGVPPEILAALTYRQQGQRGLFLTKTDAAKKEFLSLVLRLGAFEIAGDVAAKAAVVAQSRVATVQGKLQQIEAQIRAIPTEGPVVVDTKDLEGEIERHKLIVGTMEKLAADEELALTSLELDCRKQVSEVEESFRSELLLAAAAVVDAKAPPALPPITEDQKIFEALGEAKKRLQRRIDADALLRQEFDNRCRAIDAEIFNLTSLIADAGRLKAEEAELKKKIAAAEAAKCPTCDQRWLKAQEQLTTWKARLLRVEFDLTTAEQVKTTLPEKTAARKEMKFTPDAKIDQFRSIVTQLTSDLAASRLCSENERKQIQARHSVALAEAQTAFSKLQAKQVQEVAAVRAKFSDTLRDRSAKQREYQTKLDAARHEMQRVEWQLKSTVMENDQRRANHELRLEQLAELNAQFDKTKAQVVEEEATMKAELDFEDFVGYKGFLGVIFDEILAEITEETNAILAAVANTAHVTINFTSEAVTQKTGVARKEIRPIVTVGGWQAPLESGTSGGMLASIDLAVDLAVANVVSKRTNSWPGWMVLDESFNGMDAVTKETCMEMLSRQADNRLILVVDHASETKELFNDFIDIEYRNGQSTILEAS